MTQGEASAFLEQLSEMTDEAARIGHVLGLFEAAVEKGAGEAQDELESEIQHLNIEIEDAQEAAFRVADQIDWLETRILRNEQDEAVILMDRIRKDITHA